MTRKRKGAALGLWMMLAHLFEPKKVVAMEHIDAQKRIGPGQARDAATPAGPSDEIIES